MVAPVALWSWEWNCCNLPFWCTGTIESMCGHHLAKPGTGTNSQDVNGSQLCITCFKRDCKGLPRQDHERFSGMFCECKPLVIFTNVACELDKTTERLKVSLCSSCYQRTSQVGGIAVLDFNPGRNKEKERAFRMGKLSNLYWPFSCAKSTDRYQCSEITKSIKLLQLGPPSEIGTYSAKFTA